jgi:hypothetical protein
MAHREITLEQLPLQKIPVETLRRAFEKCTPYDCPSQARFGTVYPIRTWVTETHDDITMERVAHVMCWCLGGSEYIDRFAFYFSGEKVAPYEVLLEYFTQAFVKT